MTTGTPRRTTIGSYRVVDFLGAGGMGEVYRGVHLVTGRVAAVKLLTTSGRTVAMVERFRNEGRIQSTLSHAHIAALYEFFESDGVPCIAMEYVAGESLDQVVARGPLDVPAALPWFAQVVEAVAYIHARGIVHRDLKANNVRINEQGRVKLLDFGIAKSADSPRLTTDGSVVGTLHYLSPEQVTGAPATPASDTWALGVMLYEMLTGRVPFASESLTGVMARILKGSYDPPVREGAAIPAGVTRLVARCLSVEASQRPSAEALLGDVQRLMATVARDSAPAARGMDKAVAFARRRWPLLASASAAAASVAYFVWSFTMCCAPRPIPRQVIDSIAQAADRARRAGAVAGSAGGARVLPDAGVEGVSPATDMRRVTIKVFGSTAAEVWREGQRVGLTPAVFDAPIGAWLRLTLRHGGREQSIPAFQVNAENNEYVYTLAGEPPPADHP